MYVQCTYLLLFQKISRGNVGLQRNLDEIVDPINELSQGRMYKF